MTNAAGFLPLGAYKDKKEELAKMVYSFAADTGAQGTYSLGKFTADAIITSGVVYVKTACTSGASATVTIGTSSGDTDAFLTTANGAVANLTLGASFHQAATEGLKVAANETVDLVIGTADLTAGVIEVYITYITI